MRHFRFIVVVGALIAMLSVSVAYAQRFGRRSMQQNNPPATELVVARWHFGTNGAIGHMGWSHNYPYSDRHFNEHIDDGTGIDIEPGSYRIVELGSDEVFDYPFAYVSEPGEMELTDQEVENLREFIERGGFILVDDFDGPWQFETMRTQMLRAFPGRAFIPIAVDHRIFDMHFSLDDLNGMAPHVPGGEITYYGVLNDRGTVAIAAGHNNDLANFWDWYGQPRYPLKPAADAFRLGINMVIWAMTH